MREKLDTYLMVRFTKEEKEKLRIISRMKGIPNMSIYVRDLIKEEIDYHEKVNGYISLETRNEENEA